MNNANEDFNDVASCKVVLIGPSCIKYNILIKYNKQK